MLEQERGLCEREQEDQGNDAPYLERYPGRGGGGAPDGFVEDRQGQEEDAPAHRQFSPTRFVQLERLGENIFDEKPVDAETAQQHGAKESVKHGGLHLDEDVVFQIKRQPAKDQHQHGGEQRHGRDLLLDQVTDRQRQQHRRHESGGGAEYSQILEGCKKNQQRPQVERKPSYLRIHVASAPTRALAKSIATKGCKSSSPSPTPM